MGIWGYEITWKMAKHNGIKKVKILRNKVNFRNKKCLFILPKLEELFWQTCIYIEKYLIFQWISLIICLHLLNYQFLRFLWIFFLILLSFFSLLKVLLKTEVMQYFCFSFQFYFFLSKWILIFWFLLFYWAIKFRFYDLFQYTSLNKLLS